MDRERSFKRAWDVFGAPAPSTQRAGGASRHPPPTTRHPPPPPPATRHTAGKPAGAEKAGSDSAISGSSDEDEREICRIFDYLNKEERSGRTKHKAGARHKDKQAGGEIQHIERHLSMKKTLRKKMMRDLRQAFVDDPNEFRQDPTSIPDEQRNLINIQNLHISQEQSPQRGGESFLGMLKDEPDSGHGSPTRDHEATCRPKEKLSFWKRLTGGGRKSKR